MIDHKEAGVIRRYIDVRSTSPLRFFIEQFIFLFLQQIPTIFGSGLRFLIYRFILRSTGFFCIEENVTLAHPKKLHMGKNAYIGRNSYIGASGAGISLGNDSVILDNAYINIFRYGEKSHAAVKVGKNCVLASGITIHGHNGVEIGRGTLIGPKCTIITGRHGAISRDAEYCTATCPQEPPVIIGENVWIGAGCILLPAITIGDGAVIGAGAVVNMDVPSHSVAAGIPARIIHTIT